MLSYNISQSTLWVVGAFLLITLVIGLYAGRGIKNIKDYALGSGRFSTVTLTLTLLATYIGGGGTISTINEIYSIGIIITLGYFGLVISHLIFAFLLSSRFNLFHNCLTIGDLMYKLYGDYGRILTGISTFFYTLFGTVLQFYAIGKVLNILMGINLIYSIIIGGSILSLYSSLGGIKAVTITDVLQFLVLIIIIPFISALILNKAGGYKELFLKVPKEKILIFGNKKFYYYLSFFITVSIFPSLLTSPPVMQRVFMARSKDQIKNKFLVAASFDPIFRIIILTIGLAAIIVFPNIKQKDVFPYIINNLFSSGIMKGFAISGILAVLMSTADSFIHSAGLLFTHDILKPIFKKSNKSFNELLFAKISTAFIGIIAIILALEVSKGLNLRSISMLAIKSTTIILFPLLIGILGIKTDKKSFILSIFFCIITFLITNYFSSSVIKQLAVPISISISGIIFMFSHILQNKGIAWVKRAENKKEETKLWIPSPQKILDSIINSIPTPRKIYEYSRFQVMKNGSQNIIFGIYCCINFTLPYFLWDHQDPEKFNMMTNLRFIGGIMAGLLIVKDQWKEFLKPYYPLYWHITLTYCLPFITTVMFLMTGGSLSWMINIGTSIFFLTMLVSVEVFLILIPLGVSLGILFMSLYFGEINLFLNFNDIYLLAYLIIFPTIIGLLFARSKKIFYLLMHQKNVILGSLLCKDLENKDSLYLVNTLKNKLNFIFKYFETESKHGEKGFFVSEAYHNNIKKIINKIENNSNQTKEIVNMYSETFDKIDENIEQGNIYSLKTLVENILNNLKLDVILQKYLKLNMNKDIYIKLPKKAIETIILDMIGNLENLSGSTEINIEIESNRLIIRRVSKIGNYNYTKTKYLEYSLANDIIDIKK
ncbi:MAG: sodium:solute symporter family protein [Bacteroidetes bacterium]|nr:sodium:solute symporter family protein [Bacteroidota bacterium]